MDFLLEAEHMDRFAELNEGYQAPMDVPGSISRPYNKACFGDGNVFMVSR